MNIIGLDLGTKTGWCVMYDSGGVCSGTCDFADKRHERGMRYTRFRAWLEELIGQVRPGLIAWEQPHMRGGAASEVLLGFQSHIEELCSYLAVPRTTSIHTQELKKHATGKGNASKAEMVRAAWHKWGGTYAEDEADARWVADWAKGEYGRSPIDQAAVTERSVSDA